MGHTLNRYHPAEVRTEHPAGLLTGHGTRIGAERRAWSRNGSVLFGWERFWEGPTEFNLKTLLTTANININVFIYLQDIEKVFTFCYNPIL